MTEGADDKDLVESLRLDAEMLKGGAQANLTELWHSDVVKDAAEDCDRAADRIEQLSSGGWMPIESAPKGGIWIIAATRHGVVPVRWGVSWNDQHWSNGCVIYEPTHWQPLPSPPALQSLQVGGE
jgi:hypothetical protein